MTITDKIQKLYNKLDFLQDCDRWVQYRQVYKEITELERLRDEARKTNKKYAEILEIPESASSTCVKPSGTVSQLVDSASGIHARHNDQYIRTVRMDKKDPITDFLIAAGVQHEDCQMNHNSPSIFSFTIRAPNSSLTRNTKTPF